MFMMPLPLFGAMPGWLRRHHIHASETERKPEMSAGDYRCLHIAEWPTETFAARYGRLFFILYVTHVTDETH